MNLVTKNAIPAANDMTYEEPKAAEVLLPQLADFLNFLNQEQEKTAFLNWRAERLANDWLQVAKNEQKRQRAQKMNDSMIGVDKFKRRKENLRKVCEWIFMFGWSSPAIINLLLDRTGSFTSQYCVKASENDKRSKAKDAYFIQTPTSAGSYQPDFPRTVITLNQYGYDIALEHFAGMEYPELKKDKIPTGKRGTDLRHSAIIQKVAIWHSRFKPNTQFISERMYFTKNEANVKKPDGIFITTKGWVIFLECELSPKSGSAFYKFVRDVYEALKQNRCHYVVFYTDSNSIFEKYSKALHGKAAVPIYENGKRLSGKGASFRMPPEHAHRIFIHKIDPQTLHVGVGDFLEAFDARPKRPTPPALESLTEKFWQDEFEMSEFL
jgi:hypothetical protein